LLPAESLVRRLALQITVNSQPREVQDGSTVAGLLASMALDPTRVAVERNKRLVRRAEHAATALADGDELEVVTLVGGG
jgi:sulfur carrier protein